MLAGYGRVNRARRGCDRVQRSAIVPVPLTGLLGKNQECAIPPWATP
jgi:hypothetical protein